MTRQALPTVLVVDDDEKLLKLLSQYLESHQFVVMTASDGELGLKMAVQGEGPDLVVLDVMLPVRDGFSVCREIRARSNVPIIMLTARGELTDRVVGLELGADDYLQKPFEPRELVARIQAVLRRGRGAAEKKLKVGALVIDPDRQAATLDGKDMALSTAEFAVLLLLAASPKRVFTRDQIIASLHGTDWASFNRSVDVLVSRIRAKLGDDTKEPRYIKTVWGTGYKFIGGDGDA